MTPKERADNFLQVSSQFQLGHLVTEGFHPLTTQLSELAKRDVKRALNLLQQVDQRALEEMKSRGPWLWKLAQDIESTLKSGHKVFLCGCGATGRLSLVLETLYRQKFPNSSQVISFMAGGDFALIKSVESFEDRVDYGERQLIELGFGPHDLLLSSTEGGETPFVIGATNLAAKISDRSPYFLYCNPDELLKPILRSREVLENENIHKLNLTTGPMAISGSTRMQASTVLMLAIGVGLLFRHESEASFCEFYHDYLHRLTQSDYSLMGDLTQLEASLYQQQIFLNYLADAKLAISILTDTTERSPTFSLRGFENDLDSHSQHSLSYLFIPQSDNSLNAWTQLLRRSPRALEWEELEAKINLTQILGFDISSQGLKKRSQKIPTENFVVRSLADKVQFECQGIKVQLSWGEDELFNHLMVKMLLNAHSTTIMGILGRYEGNVMTWVRPSNNKLIDRCARYILEILKQRGQSPEYADVVLKIFEETQSIGPDEAIVLKVLGRYS
jgi:N-acetylmuramic acid 6-phosphate etherase